MGLRPRGYLCITNLDGSIIEADTYTCRHCQKIVWRRGEGGFCRTCDSMICTRCVGRDCVPFMRRVEEMEERYYRRRQALL